MFRAEGWYKASELYEEQIATPSWLSDVEYSSEWISNQTLMPIEGRVFTTNAGMMVFGRLKTTQGRQDYYLRQKTCDM